MSTARTGAALNAANLFASCDLTATSAADPEFAFIVRGPDEALTNSERIRIDIREVVPVGTVREM